MTSVVFMGTPAFSAPILEAVIANGYDVKAVVTQPDRPVGRKRVLTPTPVKEVALAHEIEVLQPEKISGSDEMQRVIDINPDLIITAAFGQFLPTKLLNAAKIGAINVHASLLPKYRGGAPVHYSIMNGDAKTGVSIMYMVKKMDAGDVIAVAEEPITGSDNVGTMFDKLSVLGRDLLIKTLPDLIAGNVTPVAQDEALVTFSPNISPEQEQLDFNQPAQVIDNHVRGLYPFPTAYTVINGVRTKIQGVQVIDETTDQPAGVVVKKSKKEVWLAAGAGTIISLVALQPAGKPKMSINDYLNGNLASFEEGQQVIFNG
ncbi:methionyl-tRNA formyltransferase [Periweissella ghanensis]|uniref:Methionyl-tRNA formyltransferase n=1 Tax=Periweissella ghanensis TaxID=467997 RepID=A0ABM8Z940_9LACO|nr:methionyl-tRNA formyltransferase [Periweissella ghanensis]MCM0600902.1 methionyl-tRNA formyltransferase [Periweissella ghanensis]CAH0417680.1 Methionyl-tRNA formyltransferase [Periweissella ghanensis]